MATAPKNLNYDRLRDTLTDGTSRTVIARSHLDRVAGGLYRIRDNYESIWTMEADADGRQYITRADVPDEERVYLAEDHGEQPERVAYKMVREGKVHVVWECSPCKTANITEFGNEYECDNCHDKPGDVLTQDNQKDAWTRDEARVVCADWVVERMVAEGIHKITASLLDVWTNEREAKGGPWNKPWSRQKKDKPKGGFEKVKKNPFGKGDDGDEDDE